MGFKWDVFIGTGMLFRAIFDLSFLSGLEIGAVSTVFVDPEQPKRRTPLRKKMECVFVILGRNGQFIGGERSDIGVKRRRGMGAGQTV